MARRTEREKFYNTELPFLLQADRQNIDLGGDFSCILDPVDTTGHFQNSRVLANLIRGTDTCIQNPTSRTYTHHSPSVAARLDRIYVSQESMKKKSGIEILPAAFTDHQAVALRLAFENPVSRRGRARWKMDPNLIQEARIRA